MARLRFAGIGWGVLVLAAPAATAPPDPEARARDAQALTAAIDKHVSAAWAAAKVQPAPPASDAEFCRRVYLDLIGRIPSVTEAREFLDDKRPDKRQRLIDRLLAGPNYVNHFTNVWRALLLPETAANFQARLQRPSFEAWLRKQLTDNVGYDKLVRELITAPVSGPGGRTVAAFPGNNNEPSPAGYFLAKEMKPENLAGSTTRVFLGVRLECAQCHNHPFADWKREQFWQFAAFFAGMNRQGMGDFVQAGPEAAGRRELTIPDTSKTVKARFLDGSEPKWQEGTSTRQTLADWMTRRDNPYFARAAANRTWAYFFGTGLVDPVDEMAGTDAAPSHPELLNELAKQFAAHDFDLKFLMRAITNSRAYQLSSVAGPNQADPRKFARMPLRGLTPEQLFDSVSQATGYQESRRNLPPGVILGGNGSARDEFLARFGSQNDKATDYQTSILQSLALMNGRLVGDATDLSKSELLAATLDAPFLDTAGRVEVLYLATLTRRPTDREVSRLTKFIDGRIAAGTGDSQKRHSEALADVFWALLNSGEFILNH